MDAAAPIETLATLADIEIPAPPPPGTSLLILALLAGLLILILAAAITVRHVRGRERQARTPPSTPADEALRRLDALQRDWRSGNSGDRETAYRLCTLLRIGMSLPELDPALAPAGIDQIQEWSSCLHRLREQRYGTRTGVFDPAAFEQARNWLTSHRAAMETRRV